MIYEHAEYANVFQSTAGKVFIANTVVEDITIIVESLEDVTKGLTLSVVFDNSGICRTVKYVVDVLGK